MPHSEGTTTVHPLCRAHPLALYNRFWKQLLQDSCWSYFLEKLTNMFCPIRGQPIGQDTLFITAFGLQVQNLYIIIQIIYLKYCK